MKVLTKWFAGVLALLIIGSILFPRRYINTPEQNRIQQDILNRSFAKIQKRNDKAWMVPTQRYTLWNHQDKPFLASVGTRFSFKDRHWSGSYTTTGIDEEGVSIDFEASGGSAGTNVKSSTGTVKLAWK